MILRMADAAAQVAGDIGHVQGVFERLEITLAHSDGKENDSGNQMSSEEMELYGATAQILLVHQHCRVSQRS